MDGEGILAAGGILIVMTLVVGIGILITRDQDDAQERAIACIEAGRQFVGGDCVVGPTP